MWNESAVLVVDTSVIQRKESERYGNNSHSDLLVACCDPVVVSLFPPPFATRAGMLEPVLSLVPELHPVNAGGLILRYPQSGSRSINPRVYKWRCSQSAAAPRRLHLKIRRYRSEYDRKTRITRDVVKKEDATIISPLKKKNTGAAAHQSWMGNHWREGKGGRGKG
jgi:hypothetical protein